MDRQAVLSRKVHCRTPEITKPRQSRAALAASVLPIILAAAGRVGWRLYRNVTACASPYDEVGIEVNRHLPAPVRA
jgi:hypothetical protein